MKMSSVYYGLAEFDGIEFFIKDIFHKMEIYNYYVKSKCILLRINTVYTISTLQFPNISSSLESIPSVLKSIAKYSVGPGYKTKAVLMNDFYITTYNNKQKYIMFLSAPDSSICGLDQFRLTISCQVNVSFAWRKCIMNQTKFRNLRLNGIVIQNRGDKLPISFSALNYTKFFPH